MLENTGQKTNKKTENTHVKYPQENWNNAKYSKSKLPWFNRFLRYSAWCSYSTTLPRPRGAYSSSQLGIFTGIIRIAVDHGTDFGNQRVSVDRVRFDVCPVDQPVGWVVSHRLRCWRYAKRHQLTRSAAVCRYLIEILQVTVSHHEKHVHVRQRAWHNTYMASSWSATSWR